MIEKAGIRRSAVSFHWLEADSQKEKLWVVFEKLQKEKASWAQN